MILTAAAATLIVETTVTAVAAGLASPAAAALAAALIERFAIVGYEKFLEEWKKQHPEGVPSAE